MKKILILGGQSQRNYDFVLQAADFLGKQDMEVKPFIYSHRLSEENEINWELEIERLKELKLDEFDIVLAKSIGSGLTAQLLQEGVFRTVKVLMLGLPLRVVKELNFDAYYDSLKGDVTIIQNEFDPTGSYQMISDYFQSYKSIQVICIQGNETHTYENFDLYLETISSGLMS